MTAPKKLTFLELAGGMALGNPVGMPMGARQWSSRSAFGARLGMMLGAGDAMNLLTTASASRIARLRIVGWPCCRGQESLQSLCMRCD